MIFKTTCPYCNNTVIIKADYSPTFNEFVPVIYNEIHGYNESIQISRNEYLKRKSKEKEMKVNYNKSDKIVALLTKLRDVIDELISEFTDK